MYIRFRYDTPGRLFPGGATQLETDFPTAPRVGELVTFDGGDTDAKVEVVTYNILDLRDIRRDQPHVFVVLRGR